MAEKVKRVDIVGAGLAGSEAALQLASRGIEVRLYEMRPLVQTAVHTTGDCAELVCSNSLKSLKPESAAGMLKTELSALGSFLLEIAFKCRVAAGGALAVDRAAFARAVTKRIEEQPGITFIRGEITEVPDESGSDAVILATGPLTGASLAASLQEKIGKDHLAFFDAAAPIVMADSLNYDKLFRQSRYEEGEGDYLNAPFDREEYERFTDELLAADRVVKKDFETAELFQACQPIEEIARKGRDAPRFGALKPVGLVDPRSGRRPWAAVQLRAENEEATSYNLVGFQTNLSFTEQKRVFRLIPGLEKAEFARFGLMHRNTFIDSPHVLDARFAMDERVFCAGQLTGTEGYCEALISGLYVALAVYARLQGQELPTLPACTAAGSLFRYATDPRTKDYQPMHVNFGIIEALEKHVRNKRQRYAAYAERGRATLADYVTELEGRGILGGRR